MTTDEAIAIVTHHGWTIHRLGFYRDRWDCSLRIDEWTYGFGTASTPGGAVECATLDACNKQIRRVEGTRRKPTPNPALAMPLDDFLNSF